MTRTRTQPLTLRARTPEDVLALVPVLLGFEPEESITLLTLGRTRPFHARVDLPSEQDLVPIVVETLLRPCLQHRVERVVIVAHTERREMAGACVTALHRALGLEGIEVVESLLADGQRWSPLAPGSPVPVDGVPYDVSAHPFVADAVLRGEVVFASRAAMAASLDPDPVRMTAVERHVRWDRVTPEDEELAWALDLLRDCLERDDVPSDRDLARLVTALAQQPVLYGVWQVLQRSDAARRVRLWTRVLVASPLDLRPGPALLVAYTAWLAGNGALAWCALEQVDPEEVPRSLVTLLTTLLEQAVPPTAWDGLADGSRPHGLG